MDYVLVTAKIHIVLPL